MYEFFLAENENNRVIAGVIRFEVQHWNAVECHEETFMYESVKQGLYLLQQSQQEAALQTALLHITQQLNFQYYAVGFLQPWPDSLEPILLNNWPEICQKYYQSKHLFRSDPCVQKALGNTVPVIWDELLLQQYALLWDGVTSFNCQAGISQACFNYQGVVCWLSLSRERAALQPDEREILPLITPILCAQIMAILLKLNRLEAECWHLSPRTKSVLRLSAQGKTSAEISVELNITERTVNFHIARAMEKLKVNNKTAAVVKALQCGLLRDF